MKMVPFIAFAFLISLISTTTASAWNNSTFGVLNLANNGGQSLDATATDSSGNIFIAGHTTSAFDSDPSPTSTANLASNGAADAFIAKYNSSGEYLWSKSFGGTSNDYPYGMDVDSDGNIYVTGTFQNTVDFDPGVGVSSLTSNGSHDVYILKLSSSGIFLWVKRIGTSAEERATAITLDSGNNILITGFFNQTIDFNPAPLETVTSTGPVSVDIFILKLNSDGLYQWAVQMGSSNQDMGLSIAVDSNNNIYSAGKFRGSFDFDPGAGTTILTGSSVDSAYVLKLNSEGVFSFVKSFSNSNYCDGVAIKVDSANSVYTTGTFGGTIDFDPGAGVANLTSLGSTEVYVSKLDSLGNYLWAKSIGGTSDDAAYGLGIDSSNNPHIVGYFSSTVDFDPGAGTYSLSSLQLDDGFVLKLNSAGEFVWASALRGQGSQKMKSIEFTNAGYLLVGGDFKVQIDFDPSTSVTLTFTPSYLGNNVFLLRLAPDGSLSPANLIDRALFNSLGITSGGTLAIYRVSNSLTADVNVPARISFLSNGKYLAGCRNLLTTGSGTNFTVSCTWKPSTRGSALITAIAVPTANGISTGTSTPVGLVVGNRTTKR